MSDSSTGAGVTASSTGTVTASTGATASSTASAAITWPDSWRTEFGNGDEKIAKRFERYASPRDVASALISVQNRISAGELRSALPKDANPEQIKAWRAENGIPEEPSKYELKLKPGLVVGEEDKPIIDSFLKDVAHPSNMRPEEVSKVVEWYYAEVDRQSAAQAETMTKRKTETEEALRTEWGQDYRPNRTAITALLDANLSVKDAELRKLIEGSIDTNAGFAKLLAGLARQLNPMTTLVPGVHGSQPQAIDAEIAEIEKLMRMNRAEYNRDTGKQERLRQLYAARDRLQGK